jgi:hypothetical protein
MDDEVFSNGKGTQKLLISQDSVPRIIAIVKTVNTMAINK